MMEKMDADRRREIGVKLCRIRTRKRLTQEKMAKLLGVSLVLYRRAEQGRMDISAVTLVRILQDVESLENDDRAAEDAELCYWETMISAMRKYMEAFGCTAGEAVEGLNFSHTDAEKLLMMLPGRPNGRSKRKKRGD